MKTNNSKTKAKAFLGAAFMLLVAFIFTACPQRAKPKAEEPAPPPGPQKVTFSVEGTPANGTLKAMAGSAEITSGSKVPYGTTVTFTATVTAAEHYADEWTIKGGSFKTGGKDGDTTATVQITGETEVKVNFSRYKSVAFGTDGAELAAYLNSNPPAADGIYYIKVTGLKAEHLKGEASHSPYHPSPLGKVLNDNPAKKVALKFGKLPAVTNMEACFRDCKNLTQAPMLPAGVTNLSACFYNCEGLTQAPEIPESVTNMNSCFNGCKNLIQVPAFPANAKVTNMNGCFVECENLTQVPSLPASVTEMAGCFYGCEKLTQAPSTIPKGVTNLHSCFSYCRQLTKAPVIPNSITYMKYCFKFCKELTEVTLECNYGGEEFFREAFLSCDKLTAGTIKVPADQVQTYKDNAFDMGTEQDRFVAAP